MGKGPPLRNTVVKAPRKHGPNGAPKGPRAWPYYLSSFVVLVVVPVLAGGTGLWLGNQVAPKTDPVAPKGKTAELRDRIEELEKDRNQAADALKGAEKLRSQLADALKDVEKLRERLTAPETKGSSSAVKQPFDKADLDRATQSFRELENRLKAVDKLSGQLLKLEAILTKQVQTKEKPPQPVELVEVVLFALDSNKLDVRSYSEPLKKVIRQRASVPGQKLSLYYVSTSKLELIVDGYAAGPIDERKFGRNRKDKSSATEDIASLGKEVAGKFKDPKARQRCIIIASSECKCPLDALSWKGLNPKLEVDVILVPADSLSPPQGVEEYPFLWSRWCQQVNGHPPIPVDRKDLGRLDGRLLDLLDRPRSRP